ncbi:MAG: metallophosphoesterase [Halobacteriales archaeon]
MGPAPSRPPIRNDYPARAERGDVLVVVSDTHREQDPGLEGALPDAVRSADRVVHAGDFTTASVLDGFRAVADRLDAVHGNADSTAVRDRLPRERTLDYRGARIVVTHRPEGGETGLAMLGRAREADLVVFGHTHRPAVVEGDVTLVNPGSYADPRGNRPGYATLEPAERALRGAIRNRDGDPFERFVVDAKNGV